jgi:hypothetical protein
MGLFLYKLYNILLLGKAYDIKMAWLLFVGVIILFTLGMISMMIYTTNILLSQMFQMERLLFYIQVLFIILEQLFSFDFIPKSEKRYSPSRQIEVKPSEV